MKIPILWLCLLFLCCPLYAGEFRVPLMTTPPTLDGNIEPNEWANAARFDGFSMNTLERRRVTGYVGATATHLYLAIRSQLPVEGTLIANTKRDSVNLVYDDSVEVWLEPSVIGDAKRVQVQMLANSLGHRWYRMHLPDDPTWRGEWKMANGVHNNEWQAEMEVPLDQIAPGRTADVGKWGINLARTWAVPGGAGTLWQTSLGGGSFAPTDWFTFAKQDALAIGYENRGDPFKGEINSVLTLRNPTNAPVTVHAQLVLSRDIMPETSTKQDVTVAPGATQEVALKLSDQITKKFSLLARVTSPDGKTTHFERTLTWQPISEEKSWVYTSAKKEAPPLDFNFAYYPYLNRMRIAADISNLPKNAVAQSAQAVIRQKGGATIKTVTFDAFKDRRQELEFGLPALQGQYEIALSVTGQNVPTGEMVKEFERTVYPWEHNDLGKSAKVYPPFKPIQVDGMQVFTVLRAHTVNAVGLWDQVSTKGDSLLAAPMQWQATVDGADAPIEPAPFKFTHKAENIVTAQGGFHAGALQAQSNTIWDYDGTMRVDLHLQPTDGKTVNALTLDIPLKESEATHLHAMGDGIRNTIYQKIPAGTGSVWNAKSVQAADLPPNFCTYIYVGTPKRGLCWFAENDKGWGWDAATPNLELVREPGRVILRIHFINQPQVITAPRTITFGLLAAPVKPRLPEDWRYKWRRDNYTLLGTDINWLALGDAASVYPAGKDMYLWEMIKRGNQEHLSDAAINQVVEHGKPYFAPYGADAVQTFINHAHYNLTSRYGKKMVFYYNRASYQDSDEFETFKDEWALNDLRSVGKGISRGEIKVVPSESYIDHALYWYGKSFDIGGNQGVYWDNWFFAGSYNTEMTNAYHKSDGTTVPSTGVWGLRELAKRTFQYENERGMLPVTMPHMTSTSILPMLSFATVQYDWEWKYSEGDVQDRFTRDYIQLVTDGELAGTWPVLLSDQGKLADDPWTGRTFAAVAMLHELDASYANWTKTGQAQNALFKPVDDILAQPGVEAYRYWDERPQPIVTDNPDLPDIVYSVNGKQALCAIVSYAATDQTANVTLDPIALGFTHGYKVTDAETGAALTAQNNKLSFPLKKHDIKLLKVVAP